MFFPRNEDNLWIVKPWNLGRGLGIHITGNLVKVIRLAQSGPKVSGVESQNKGDDPHSNSPYSHFIILTPCIPPQIVSRYITNPVLFLRPEVGWVKFDYRYVILLSSVKPLELYIYNVFWLRFANK